MKTSVINQPYVPIVEYTPIAMHKIKMLVRECSKEVGWFGSVSTSEGEGYKYFLIEDIYVPKQSVTGTETDVKAEDLIKLYEEIEAGGIDLSKVFYWGHSHVDMPPNPSGQDESQLVEYGDAYPVFLRGIYNKAGVERMDVFDFKSNLRFDLVEAEVMMPSMTAEEETKLNDLIKERVSERSYVYHRPPSLAARQNSGLLKPSRLYEDDYLDGYGLGAGGFAQDIDDIGFWPSQEKKQTPTLPTSIVGIHSRR